MTIAKIKKKRLQSFINKWSDGASYTEGGDCIVPLKGSQTSSPTIMRYHVFKSRKNLLDCEISIEGQDQKQAEKLMQSFRFYTEELTQQ